MRPTYPSCPLFFFCPAITWLLVRGVFLNPLLEGCLLLFLLFLFELDLAGLAVNPAGHVIPVRGDRTEHSRDAHLPPSGYSPKSHFGNSSKFLCLNTSRHSKNCQNYQKRPQDCVFWFHISTYAALRICIEVHHL